MSSNRLTDNHTVILLRHLNDEEAFLRDVASAMTKISLESSRLETSTDLFAQLSGLLEQVERTNAARSSVLSSIEQPGSTPEEAFRNASDQPEIRQQMNRVRQQASQTAGVIRSALRLMFMQNDLIDISFAALGVKRSEGRYDSTGKRMEVEPALSIGLRS